MNRKLAASISLLAGLWVTACGQKSDYPGPIVDKVYVITQPDQSRSFTTHLSSVVRKHGLIPKLGRAIDDKGHSNYVLDATHPSVRLRSENVLLSGQEEPAECGVYDEPHSDPGQYFISVSQSTRVADPHDSRVLLAKIVKDLKEDGYDVRRRPMICSEQSKFRKFRA